MLVVLLVVLLVVVFLPKIQSVTLVEDKTEFLEVQMGTLWAVLTQQVQLNPKPSVIHGRTVTLVSTMVPHVDPKHT